MHNNSISTLDVWLAVLQEERMWVWFVGVPEMHLEKIGNFIVCIPRRLGYCAAITC